MRRKTTTRWEALEALQLSQQIHDGEVTREEVYYMDLASTIVWSSIGESVMEKCIEFFNVSAILLSSMCVDYPVWTLAHSYRSFHVFVRSAY